MKSFLRFVPDWWVLILLIAVLGWAIHNSDEFDKECRAAGGEPLGGRGLTCVKPETVIHLQQKQQ